MDYQLKDCIKVKYPELHNSIMILKQIYKNIISKKGKDNDKANISKY